jgi:hypothetical protein
MGTLRRQYDLMIQLMLDGELRERFYADDARDEVIRELGLDDDDVAVLGGIDRFGLEVDARVRRDYILSALCRAFPLTAAGIGASAQGKNAIVAFLSSHRIRDTLGERTAAFGDHLGRLLSLGAVGLSRQGTVLLEGILTLERARVDVAAAVRAEVEEKGPQAAPGPPAKPTASLMKRGKLALPPFFIAQELRMPLSVVQNALDDVSADSAWHKIRDGALSAGRLDAVARALPMPVTVASRAITRGVSVERAGAGGVSPLVDVRHLVAELSGAQGAWLQRFDGSRTLAELEPGVFRTARQLAEQGLLELRT